MEDINFDCPHCGQNIDAPPELGGCIVDCPSCPKRVKVPPYQGNLVRCPHCQNYTNPIVPFCRSCGQPLFEEKISAQPASSASIEFDRTSTQQQTKKPQGKMAEIIFVILCSIGILLFLVPFDDENSQAEIEERERHAKIHAQTLRDAYLNGRDVGHRIGTIYKVRRGTSNHINNANNHLKESRYENSSPEEQQHWLKGFREGWNERNPATLIW